MEQREHRTRTHRSVEERMSCPTPFISGKEDSNRFTVISLHREGLAASVLNLRPSREREATATRFSSSDVTSKSPKFE